MKFRKAQVLITRKCNLSCFYCKISKKELEEINLEKWKEAILVMNKLGIKFLKIMGGEPTQREDLEDLIRFVKQNTEIKVGIFTNSKLDYKRLDSLVEAGMDQYLTSVDTLSFKSDNTQKSAYGVRALLYLRKIGFENLRANIVVGRNNIQSVPQTVEYLSSKGIYSTLSPLHVGTEDFWEYRCHPNGLELTTQDRVQINNLVKELLPKMKRKHLLIANSEEFIRDWPRYAIGTSWHCEFPPVLWVDADGKIMCCNDIRGETSRMSIFDLKENKHYTSLLRLMMSDAKKCPGCFYNCQYDGKIFV
jgi:MoaA/NifB/PqqE/SkfB family radical SAM enzyme